LENVVGRMIAMPDSTYFLEQLTAGNSNKSLKQEAIEYISDDENFPGLQFFIQEQERKIIQRTLKKAGQNISDAARLLKIPRSTLRSKMEKLEIIGPEVL